MGQRLPLIAGSAHSLLLLAGFTLVALTGTVSGQQVCELIPDPDAPGWQTLSCRPDVSISPSVDAVFTLTDDTGNGRVDTLDLGAGAVRTRVERANDPTHFQIRTGQAIVSVRGTDWATALTEAGTEVFVVSGEVQVVDLALTAGVILTPGLGVDVPDDTVPAPPADDSAGDSESGGAPLASRSPAAEAEPASALRPTRWGEARVDALLQRFPGA